MSSPMLAFVSALWSTLGIAAQEHQLAIREGIVSRAHYILYKGLGRVEALKPKGDEKTSTGSEAGEARQPPPSTLAQLLSLFVFNLTALASLSAFLA